MNTKSKKEKGKTNPLEKRIEEINFREIKETEINAQEMDETTFKRLVKNIKKDECLTSTPLIMESNKGYICISGHHRIRAAIKAGLTKAYCMIIKEVDYSTRMRLQLSHNDITGKPNEEILALIQSELTEEDIKYVDEIEAKEKEASTIDYDIPTFQYINICLTSESREELIDMIMSLDKADGEKWLVNQDNYKDVEDLLSYAFEKGFRTPGQAFGKFLDIIKENKHLIER